jgi:phosphoglycolate phosphatase
LRIYDQRLLRHTRAYDGVEPLLEALASRMPLAVLTNKPLAATHGILDGLNLTRHFHGGVLGGDGPLPRKPDPAGLRHLMSSTRAAARSTLLVGDSRVDQYTARAAGTRCCLARYGFGFHTVNPSELSETETLIDAPLDLMTQL